MKALMKKDVLMARRYLRIAIFAPLLFALIGAVTERGTFYLMIAPIMAVGNVISLIAYDERFHWDRTCDMLPVSRRLQVTEKYAVLALLLGLTLLVCAALSLLRFGPSETAQRLAVMLTLALVQVCILLPLVFRLGVEKARLVYYIVVGISAALGVQFQSGFGLKLAPVWGWAAILLLFALSVLSWRMSVRFYEKREL